MKKNSKGKIRSLHKIQIKNNKIYKHSEEAEGCQHLLIKDKGKVNEKVNHVVIYYFNSLFIIVFIKINMRRKLEMIKVKVRKIKEL